ncbi:MAG: hypothetical protein QXV32_08720 [Conexivisphaerales archaeon]
MSSQYPVSEQFKVIDGYDIYRSENLLIALVVVEGQGGKDLRLYRWQKRKGEWKVDLCRMSVAKWPWEEITKKVQEFTEKYSLK